MFLGTRNLTCRPFFFLRIIEGGINDVFAQNDEYVSFRYAYYFVKSLKLKERNNAHFDDGIAFISLPNLFLFYFTFIYHNLFLLFLLIARLFCLDL